MKKQKIQTKIQKQSTKKMRTLENEDTEIQATVSMYFTTATTPRKIGVAQREP